MQIGSHQQLLDSDRIDTRVRHVELTHSLSEESSLPFGLETVTFDPFSNDPKRAHFQSNPLKWVPSWVSYGILRPDVATSLEMYSELTNVLKFT